MKSALLTRTWSNLAQFKRCPTTKTMVWQAPLSSLCASSAITIRRCASFVTNMGLSSRMMLKNRACRRAKLRKATMIKALAALLCRKSSSALLVPAQNSITNRAYRTSLMSSSIQTVAASLASAAHFTIVWGAASRATPFRSYSAWHAPLATISSASGLIGKPLNWRKSLSYAASIPLWFRKSSASTVKFILKDWMSMFQSSAQQSKTRLQRKRRLRNLTVQLGSLDFQQARKFNKVAMALRTDLKAMQSWFVLATKRVS